MGTKNTVWLISGGVNYYLSGGAATQTPYSGSGAPWTSEATTPYELSLNDATGGLWVAQPAPTQVIYGGGKPFRPGATPLYQSYDNITESVGVQMKATTKDNAIALLRQLRAILNTTFFSVPCVLAVQGGTNTAYYEIYTADVPESALYLTEPNGEWRALITWTRTPHGGRLSTGESLFNSTTFTNTGTGANKNTQAYPAGAGDLIYEGQPINMVLAFGSSSDARKTFYMASVYSQTYTSLSSLAMSTASTTGVSAADVSNTITDIIGRKGLKPRWLVRLTSVTANFQCRMIVRLGDAQIVVTTPWQTPEYASDLVDFGTWPTDIFQDGMLTTGSAYTELQYRSSDGLTASATGDYREFLLYYDFCRIDLQTATSSASNIWVTGFTEQTNRPCLPVYPARAMRMLGTDPVVKASPRGKLPRYWSGASLYLAWKRSTSGHTTSDTASVTATHGPLYRTLRGAG